MKGDKKIFMPVHYRKAENILKFLLKRVPGVNQCSKFVIAIGGQSGTGKTEVACILQEYLYKYCHKTVKVVHTDDYYKTLWYERDMVRLKKGLKSVGKKEINWSKLNRVIRYFKQGKKEIQVQQIHMFTDSIEKQIVDCRKLKILIVEGLYALFAKNIDFGIYLEGEIEDTYRFRKLRGKENPDDEYRKKVLKIEAKEVKESKAKAKLIVTFEGKVIENV